MGAPNPFIVTPPKTSGGGAANPFIVKGASGSKPKSKADLKKQKQNALQRLASIPGEAAKDVAGAGKSALVIGLDVLDRPVQGVKGLAFGKGPVKGLQEAWKGLSGQKRFSVEQAITQDENAKLKGVGGFAANFVGDVLLDPLTYATLGTSAVAKVGLKNVAKSTLGEAGKEAIAKSGMKGAGISREAVEAALRPIVSDEKILARQVKALEKGGAAGIKIGGNTIIKGSSLGKTGRALTEARPAAAAMKLVGKSPAGAVGRGLRTAFIPHAKVKDQVGKEAGTQFGESVRLSDAQASNATEDSVVRMAAAGKGVDDAGRAAVTDALHDPALAAALEGPARKLFDAVDAERAALTDTQLAAGVLPEGIRNTKGYFARAATPDGEKILSDALGTSRGGALAARLFGAPNAESLGIDMKQGFRHARRFMPDAHVREVNEALVKQFQDAGFDVKDGTKFFHEDPIAAFGNRAQAAHRAVARNDLVNNLGTVTTNDGAPLVVRGSRHTPAEESEIRSALADARRELVATRLKAAKAAGAAKEAERGANFARGRQRNAYLRKGDAVGEAVTNLDTSVKAAKAAADSAKADVAKAEAAVKAATVRQAKAAGALAESRKSGGDVLRRLQHAEAAVGPSAGPYAALARLAEEAAQAAGSGVEDAARAAAKAALLAKHEGEELVKLYRGEGDVAQQGGTMFAETAKAARKHAGDTGKVVQVEVPKSVADAAKASAKAAGHHGGEGGAFDLPREWADVAGPEEMVTLYRGEGSALGFDTSDPHSGRWFTNDPEYARTYAKDGKTIKSVKVPRSVAQKWTASVHHGQGSGDGISDDWFAPSNKTEVTVPEELLPKAKPDVKALEREVASARTAVTAAKAAQAKSEGILVEARKAAARATEREAKTAARKVSDETLAEIRDRIKELEEAIRVPKDAEVLEALPEAVRGSYVVTTFNGERIAVHQSVKQDLEAMENLLSSDEAMRGLAQHMNRVNALWKGMATVLPVSGGFFSRNAETNIFAAWLKGLKNPARYTHAMRIQRAAAGGRKAGEIGGSLAGEDRKLWDLARKWGVLEGGMQVQDVGNVALDANLGKAGTLTQKAKNLGPIRAGRKVNSAVENNARLALFIDGMKKHGDPEQAARTVKEALFDYGDLTPVERKVFRNVMGFYTFARKNVALQAKELARQPGKMSAIEHFRQALIGSAEGELPEGTEVPAYLQKSGGFLLPRGLANVAAPGSEGPTFLQPDIGPTAALSTLDPFIQAARALVPGGEDIDTAETARGLLSVPSGVIPAGVQALMERSTGKDSFTGSPSDDPLQKLLLEGLIPGIRKFERARKDLTGGNAASFLGGVRATEVDEAKEKAELYRQLDKIQRRMAELKKAGKTVPTLKDLGVGKSKGSNPFITK